MNGLYVMRLKQIFLIALDDILKENGYMVLMLEEIFQRLDDDEKMRIYFLLGLKDKSIENRERFFKYLKFAAWTPLLCLFGCTFLPFSILYNFGIGLTGAALNMALIFLTLQHYEKKASVAVRCFHNYYNKLAKKYYS